MYSFPSSRRCHEKQAKKMQTNKYSINDLAAGKFLKKLVRHNTTLTWDDPLTSIKQQ